MSNHSYPNDEISLRSIKAFVLSVLFIVVKFVGGIPVFLRRNLILIIITTAICLLGAYTKSLLFPQSYSLKMIVQHTELTKKTYAEIINQLNSLVTDGSDSLLAQKLRLNNSEASSILSIEGKSMLGGPLSLDTVESVPLPFIIIAKVESTVFASKLQGGLLHYFNNNDYLKKVKDGTRDIYLQRLRFIDTELEKLDTLKKQYNTFLGSSQKVSMFYNNAFNPSEIYEQSDNYQAQKEGILVWLNEKAEPLRLIEGFSPKTKPTANGIIENLLYGAIIGFVVSCIIAIFLEADKKIKQNK